MNQTLMFSNMIEVKAIIDGIPNYLVGLYWFELISACLIYGIGFLGNIFALFIFSSLEEFRKISTGVLFLLMTISNFFHLWTLATESLGLYGYHLYHHVFFQCRLNLFIKNVSHSMSTYLSVGIAIDRFIRSEMPIRSRRICTFKHVCKTTIILLIIFCVYWSFYLLPFSNQDSLTHICYYNQTAGYYFFLTKVNIPLRALFFCLIPVVIMATANIRMLNNIRRSHHRISNSISILHPPTHIHHRTSAIDRMLFYIMIANVSIFIITQVPFHFYSLVEIYIEDFDNFIHIMIYGMFLLWSSIYFGIAFYLYCLASPLFRKKFIDITKRILCYKIQHEPEE